MKPDILDLLATPPTRGDKIEIEGISLSAALAHPVLGPALEDFQSRLHWSKNDSLEDGAAGIELFLLAHAFAQAGFPIRTMPAPRRAAEIIWVQTMRRLEPQYWRALRALSSCRDSNLPQGEVLIAETIHGSRTLLEHAVGIYRSIVWFWRKIQRSAPTSQFEDFALPAEDAVIRAAERYDPRRGAKFTTYARYRLAGLAKDWIDERKDVRVELFPEPTSTVEDQLLAEKTNRTDPLFSSYAPGGQASAIPVPNDDWASEWLADKSFNLDKIANRAGLSHQEREIYELMLVDASPEQWSALARHQRISHAALKMRRSRLQKKLRDAVT